MKWLSSTLLDISLTDISQSQSIISIHLRKMAGTGESLVCQQNCDVAYIQGVQLYLVWKQGKDNPNVYDLVFDISRSF